MVFFSLIAFDENHKALADKNSIYELINQDKTEKAPVAGGFCIHINPFVLMRFVFLFRWFCER